MKKFLRSINQKLQKRIVVANGGEEKSYASLCDMPSSDRMDYVLNAMNSVDDSEMTAEQYATIKASVKNMMIRQALSRQNA